MENMKRQTPYPDSNANLYAASQMQHIPGHRMPQNAGMNNVPPEQERPYVPLKAEVQWQWDREAPKGSNPMMSHLYPEGDAARSFYQGQVPDPKVDLEKQANKEPRLGSHEQDMEIGYEDKSSPVTFEGLEHKFQDEILKLVKEQSDAEDAENARHREKMIEINLQYLEKLSSLRAQQANRREELLHKESQARIQKYQQESRVHQLTNAGLSGPHGYNDGGAAAEMHRAYATGQFEPYRERSPFIGGGRSQATEARVPYPQGRVYNSAGRNY